MKKRRIISMNFTNTSSSWYTNAGSSRQTKGILGLDHGIRSRVIVLLFYSVEGCLSYFASVTNGMMKQETLSFLRSVTSMD